MLCPCWMEFRNQSLFLYCSLQGTEPICFYFFLKAQKVEDGCIHHQQCPLNSLKMRPHQRQFKHYPLRATMFSASSKVLKRVSTTNNWSDESSTYFCVSVLYSQPSWKCQGKKKGPGKLGNIREFAPTVLDFFFRWGSIKLEWKTKMNHIWTKMGKSLLR